MTTNSRNGRGRPSLHWLTTGDFLWSRLINNIEFGACVAQPEAGEARAAVTDFPNPLLALHCAPGQQARTSWANASHGVHSNAENRSTTLSRLDSQIVRQPTAGEGARKGIYHPCAVCRQRRPDMLLLDSTRISHDRANNRTRHEARKLLSGKLLGLRTRRTTRPFTRRARPARALH